MGESNAKHMKKRYMFYAIQTKLDVLGHKRPRDLERGMDVDVRGVID